MSAPIVSYENFDNRVWRCVTASMFSIMSRLPLKEGNSIFLFFQALQMHMALLLQCMEENVDRETFDNRFPGRSIADEMWRVFCNDMQDSIDSQQHQRTGNGMPATAKGKGKSKGKGNGKSKHKGITRQHTRQAPKPYDNYEGVRR